MKFFTLSMGDLMAATTFVAPKKIMLKELKLFKKIHENLYLQK